MVKPEWGTKRICQSCSARFYDFAKSPIICPACGATFEVEAVQRGRRTRAPGRAAASTAAAAAAVEAEPATADNDDLEDVSEEATGEDEDYENADELGEADEVDVVRPDDDDETN